MTRLLYLCAFFICFTAGCSLQKHYATVEVEKDVWVNGNADTTPLRLKLVYRFER